MPLLPEGQWALGCSIKETCAGGNEGPAGAGAPPFPHVCVETHLSVTSAICNNKCLPFMPCRPTDYLTLHLPNLKGHSEPLWPQFSSVSRKSSALTGAALPLFHKQLRHRLRPDHQTPRHSSARARSARAGFSHFLAQVLCTSLSQPPQESTAHRQRLGVHPQTQGQPGPQSRRAQAAAGKCSSPAPGPTLTAPTTLVTLQPCTAGARHHAGPFLILQNPQEIAVETT